MIGKKKVSKRENHKIDDHENEFPYNDLIL